MWHVRIMEYFPVLKRKKILINVTTWIQSAIYEIDDQQGPALQHRKLYSIFYNNLYGKRI